MKTAKELGEIGDKVIDLLHDLNKAEKLRVIRSLHESLVNVLNEEGFKIYSRPTIDTNTILKIIREELVEIRDKEGDTDYRTDKGCGDYYCDSDFHVCRIAKKLGYSEQDIYTRVKVK